MLVLVFNFILVLILMLLLIGADHDWRWLKLIWLVLIWVDFDWCWFILIEIYWCWLNVSILQLAVLNPIFNIHFHIEMNIDSAGDFIISMLIFVIFDWYWSTLMIVLGWHWLTLIDWYGLCVKCKRYFCLPRIAFWLKCFASDVANDHSVMPHVNQGGGIVDWTCLVELSRNGKCKSHNELSHWKDQKRPRFAKTMKTTV